MFITKGRKIWSRTLYHIRRNQTCCPSHPHTQTCSAKSKQSTVSTLCYSNIWHALLEDPHSFPRYNIHLGFLMYENKIVVPDSFDIHKLIFEDGHASLMEGSLWPTCYNFLHLSFLILDRDGFRCQKWDPQLYYLLGRKVRSLQTFCPTSTSSPTISHLGCVIHGFYSRLAFFKLKVSNISSC